MHLITLPGYARTQGDEVEHPDQRLTLSTATRSRSSAQARHGAAAVLSMKDAWPGDRRVQTGNEHYISLLRGKQGSPSRYQNFLHAFDTPEPPASESSLQGCRRGR